MAQIFRNIAVIPLSLALSMAMWPSVTASARGQTVSANVVSFSSQPNGVEPLPLPVPVLDLKAKVSEVLECESMPESEKSAYKWKAAAIIRRFNDVWGQLTAAHQTAGDRVAYYDSEITRTENEYKNLREQNRSFGSISEVNAYNALCLEYNRKLADLQKQFRDEVNENNATTQEKEKAVENWLKNAPIASTIEEGDRLLQKYRHQAPQSTSVPRGASSAPVGSSAVDLRGTKYGTARKIDDLIAVYDPQHKFALSDKNAALRELKTRTAHEKALLQEWMDYATSDPYCPALSGFHGEARENRVVALSHKLAEAHQQLSQQELDALQTIRTLSTHEIVQKFEVLRHQGRFQNREDLSVKTKTNPTLARDVAKIINDANNNAQKAMDESGRQYDKRLRLEFRKIMGYAAR